MSKLPKIKLSGEGIFTAPEPSELTRLSRIGSYVKTRQSGKEYVGVLKGLHDNKAIIETNSCTVTVTIQK